MAPMVVSGSAVDRWMVIVLGLVVVVLAFFLLRRSAKLAISVWLFTLCFVPVWIGLSVGVSGNSYVPLASAAAVVVIVSLVPATRFRPEIPDGLMVLILIMTVAALFTGHRTIALSFVVSFLTYFVVGYVLGRVIPARVEISWIYALIGVFFTIVAALAILEFFTGFNLFVQFKVNNLSFDTWGSIQSRGGGLRAEGAFGHSIALGSSLALAIPITLASRFRFWIRGVMVLVMLCATALTFSRIGIIGAILGLTLSILFLHGSMLARTRIALAAIGAVAALALSPLISTVFTNAGQEASGSAAYRADLLLLVRQMNLIGVADSARRSADDQIYFGAFRSIDSQLILTGLSGGLLMLIAVITALVVAVVLMLTGRANAPTIAIVAQIPAFATVALITQYAIFVWFVIGLAGATQLAPTRRSRRGSDRHTSCPAPDRSGSANEPRMPLVHAERGQSELILKPSE